MMIVFTLAFKSFFYRKKQYFSLFLVCALGTSISLFFLFVMNGMMASLKNKARIYYGGDYQLIGGKNELGTENTQDFIKILKEVFPSDAVITERLDYDASRASFYFEGNTARQKVVKGIDFKKESELFSSVNFIEGSFDNIKKGDILLSKIVASMLCVSEGDIITLMANSSAGLVNTIDLYVKGIFEDSSLFGMYTSYMDINDLRTLLSFSDDYSNRICIDLNGKNISKEDTFLYHKKLSEKINMFDLVDDKQLFYDPLLSKKFLKETFALIPLHANLQDVKILITAMRIITFFIISILLLIITIGISTTFKILVMKRINEIGIYMSLGMNRSYILFTILAEVIFLILAASFSGIILSLLFCKILSFFNFSFIPAFDIFLNAGSITALVDFSYICIICLLFLFFTVAAVSFSIIKFVKIMPSKALSVTE